MAGPSPGKARNRIVGDPMRALKVLVVVMGLMIVVGFTALIVIIVGRVSNRTPPPDAMSAASATPAPAPAGQAFAAPPVELPAGARIEGMAVGADRVVLNIALPDNQRQLVVIDIASGRRLGTIPLKSLP